MPVELLRILGLGTAALALVAGGVLLVWARQRARRRRQREAIWRELCLRLELVSEANTPRSATGQLQGTGFSLHDTGSDWLVEFPVDPPLLPSGVLLVPAKDGSLRPRFKLRRLRWPAASPPPSAFVWYANPSLPPSKVAPPEAFLDEAERAAEAHAPLRVEPRRLVHALPASAAPSVNDVRDAVRALEATARRWLDVVARHGLPHVRALPRLPSALSLLRGVVAQRELLRWLLANNAAIPLMVAVLLMGWRPVFFTLLVLSLIALRKVRAIKAYGFRGLALGVLAVASSFGTSWFWTQPASRGTSPPVILVREAAILPHRKAEVFRFHDAVLRTDLTSQGAGQLIPVVPKNWEPDEQVTVWAVRPPSSPEAHATLGGTAVERSRYYQKTAIAVALEHKFPIHPHAVFVDFSQHPDDEQTRNRRWALLLWGVPNALWLGTVLVRWRQAFRKSRRVLDE